ncbi:putative cell wall binding repeat protein [Clostridium saccharobutylicum]|uniref:Putative cell wall binding repeat protein n=1 Tax=Clostridium saccharobutylicum DSM 13864 TaxID=1345695 RepID=U5MMZ6_CLOSA|nr:putative cell wall binding repeat protein [Clostridium saccharobutylicum]AGX42184.1 putative cell wall binding repeat protein [Clostridium saccharobutylicum DSM 13864]AQR89465.1 putative cell wall binding repeat protein [Clostridium saccharobutylicum]AQR99367.1 putative cell wall binding repeat protein [Clostridium saccharobutylicum]AQS09098.1 putative cell wall binding repeat protein [Clostridium saccharobutylicum]AQS13353.1 putative cell wall binding repeat protein [Clostridium saccharobu
MSKWIQDGGNWYYLGSDGNMIHGMNVDGYFLARNGVYTDSAHSDVPDYTKQGVCKTADWNSSMTSLTRQEFDSYVASGKIKASVVYSHERGQSVSVDNPGSIQFYLAN